MEFTDGHRDSPPIPASYFTGRGGVDRLMEKARMREEIRQEMEMEMAMAMARRAFEAEIVMEQYALRGGLSLRSSQHPMDFALSPQPRRRLIQLGASADEAGNMPLLLNHRELRGMDPVSSGAPQEQKLLILINESKTGEENKTSTKRKAPSPPPQADEEIDLPLVEIVKKTEENRFFCEVCRVSCNSKLSLEAHLGGRKHKSKEAALSAKKEAAAEENQGFPFWCRECKVGAETEDGMLRHELGKRHMKLLGTPESKFSILVNDFAEWVDACEKESICGELMEKAEPEELQGV